MVYGNFKDLVKRTAPDKILRDKAFNIGKILNMMDYKGGLLPWFKNFLIKSPPQAMLLLIKRLNKIYK